MKTKLGTTLGVALLGLTMPLLALAANETASGAGHITAGGELRTFAFVANKDSAGNTLGELQLDNRALDAKIHADINCLSVAGNVATMSGTVQDATNFPVGTPVWVKVADNGEGSNAPSDQITLLLLFTAGPGIPCSQDIPQLPLQDIEEGNVQVH